MSQPRADPGAVGGEGGWDRHVCVWCWRVCTVQGRQIPLGDIHDAGSGEYGGMISRHGVGHLPCHTLSKLTEFSVICLFRPPEELGVQEGFIVIHKEYLKS